jgi:hypothetical protein
MVQTREVWPRGTMSSIACTDRGKLLCKEAAALVWGSGQGNFGFPTRTIAFWRNEVRACKGDDVLVSRGRILDCCCTWCERDEMCLRLVVGVPLLLNYTGGVFWLSRDEEAKSIDE